MLKARDTAEERLKDYSNEIVELLMEDQNQAIDERIIVSEIREAKNFWPQFVLNLAGGFVCAVLFAMLLTIIALCVINDMSPVKIGD